ncbi:hypothetical protein H8356DRAFT_1288446 [Neocallimastix lanati (nom. inval.)]|nr:hypothetical protein H8356DRAFT_1288446 [Neocallimastix sp. JGI-2020a]
MLLTLIYLIFINIIGAKNIEPICKKHYTVDSERSCFEITNNAGIENLKFFNLNPSIDCTILVNSTLNDIFNFYGKKSYSKFNKIYELVDSLIVNENEKFNYNQCANNCENGQSYYEKILNDHNNPYNFKTIKEINTYYGLTTDTLIKDPYHSYINFCKSVQLLERKEVENDKKNEYNQEKENNSTIQEVNIDKRGGIRKSAISSNYQEPYLQYLRSHYGPDKTTVLYNEYQVITRVKQEYRRDESLTFEDGVNHPFLYRVYQLTDGCSHNFLRVNEKEVRNVVDAVCNRHDVCYFRENSKDRCDDLLLNGFHKTNDNI